MSSSSATVRTWAVQAARSSAGARWMVPNSPTINRWSRWRGQAGVGEPGDGVPRGGPDHDLAKRVAVAYDSERLGEQVVPSLAGPPAVWLVDQLEPDRRRQFGVTLADLRPQREKPAVMTGGVGAQLVVVMHVDDHFE